MDKAAVERRFPCGEVEEYITNYKVVIIIMRLFYLALAMWAFWHSRHGDIWNHLMIDYIVIVFCLWRIHHQGDPVVYICNKGIVIRRKAADFFERIDMVWDVEKYYNYIPYGNIVGFTANWEEIHVANLNDGGLMIISVDLQFLHYADKMRLLSIIDDRGHKDD